MSEKKAISLRLDEGVLNWFKKSSPQGGYQTAINRVLREVVRFAQDQELRACGRAQEIFRQFYTQCFWHLKPDLQVTPDNLFLILNGLRTHGGHKGLQIAFELEEELARAYYKVSTPSI